ncbi:hypothetical protein GUITHDRAFT_154193 [Guillardia theta CCMP2712]|uniref:Uncharacterized protein n=1 Tax=Guillardia theta (strain CCMP2712) TaxID=905079 RepID=L1IVU3_GUITC|nr:hypothetical protein GUITHDRAFT_154193 [Guillardia theta CCMP2712]EKX40227.1 hypothetical protein GUITHDRAFT_154193 [Guillardia theta CCMP2712]|eukprot:XP_005827207.1 hypothetical protein GUITHDRAFT_154193 [Guillardia theta CCMP2712]
MALPHNRSPHDLNSFLQLLQPLSCARPRGDGRAVKDENPESPSSRSSHGLRRDWQPLSFRT